MLSEHGGTSGLRDEGGFDQPRQILTYESRADLCKLAAAYGLGLSRNHPFVEGNKRIAAWATIPFLRCNGRVFTAPEAEVVVLFRLLAAGEMTEVAFAGWLTQHCRHAGKPRDR